MRLQADKLAETKGLSFLDREKAKHHAKQQVAIWFLIVLATSCPAATGGFAPTQRHCMYPYCGRNHCGDDLVAISTNMRP